MRPVLRGLAAGLVIAGHVVAAYAQQGNVQVSGAMQSVTGTSRGVTGENAIDPDFGVSWLQPGVRFGTFQIELRGAKRADRLHLGRNYAALRDLKAGRLSWTFEAGDAYFTRGVGEYGFSNLTTPAVTFSGGAVSARGPRGALHILGGRSTAWRNIFGTDPDTMAQTLGMVRGAYKPWDRVEVLGRVSRIRTSDLREFSFSIADSKQAGGGVRVIALPSVQLVADASFVEYRRVDSNVQVRDGSYFAGASILMAKGWMQFNAARFSPGEFPALNDPLHDRQMAFGAGEYDFGSRARVFAGVESVRTNIDPDLTLPASASLPRTTATRGFGGLRFQLGAQSAVTLRIEEGDRISRPVRSGLDAESDTGARSAEWQALYGPLTAYTRYIRRENVDHRVADSSYTQDDLSTQLFVSVARNAQIFGLATIAHHDTAANQGSSYWQVGGGAQLQLASKNLWLRGEGNASRNVDRITREFIPRESLNVGLNGQLARATAFSFNIAADRIPFGIEGGTPWTMRSTVRVVQNFSTGTARVVPTGGMAAAASRPRGTGHIIGIAYTDWNGNAVQEPDETPLENIPVRVTAVSTVMTRRDGEFSFLNVPAGPQQVALDTAALPVDFDPPAISSVDIELDRGTTRRVSFGLIPLGSVRGRVIHDANGNGRIDPGEEPIEGAVLVLDGGARSEQVRRGAYRFDSIRSGDHVISLLKESLPEGAVITGASQIPLALNRNQLSVDIDFAVVVQKRPETRKVFPPRGGAPPPSPPAAARKPQRSPGSTAADRTVTVVAAEPATASAPARGRTSGPSPGRPQSAAADGTQQFAVQVAALRDPLRARSVARDLSAAGYNAYIISPDDAAPTRPTASASAGIRQKKRPPTPPPAWAASAARSSGSSPSARVRSRFSTWAIGRKTDRPGKSRSDPVENRDLTLGGGEDEADGDGVGAGGRVENEFQPARAETAAGPACGDRGSHRVERAGTGAGALANEGEGGPIGTIHRWQALDGEQDISPALRARTG
jgi:cell division septation protein DedD